MPYIAPPIRRFVDQEGPTNAGELNYAITRLLAEYINVGGLRYQTINDVLGVLEGAKFEFHRRVAAEYEDKKRAVNGDVYI